MTANMKITDLEIERPSFEATYLWRCRICGNEEGYIHSTAASDCEWPAHEIKDRKIHCWPQGWSFVNGSFICPRHLEKIMEVLAKEKEHG